VTDVLLALGSLAGLFVYAVVGTVVGRAGYQSAKAEYCPDPVDWVADGIFWPVYLVGKAFVIAIVVAAKRVDHVAVRITQSRPKPAPKPDRIAELERELGIGDES
jgi:hypothetical protein